MDAVDHAILSHLQDDGRLSNVELAERDAAQPVGDAAPRAQPRGRRRDRRLPRGDRPEAVGRGFQVTVHTTLMLRNRETIEAFEAALARSTR